MKRDPVRLAAVGVLASIVLMALGAELGLWGAGFDALSDQTLAKPSGEHPLGTDILGRDLWQRAIAASRTSVAVGIAAATLSVVFGTAAGALVGLTARRLPWLDRAVSTLVDALSSVPPFVLLLGVALVLGPGRWRAALAIGVVEIAPIYRLIRQRTVEIAGREYVMASRAMGERAPSIARRHVLPHLRPLVLGLVAVSFGYALHVEAALSFFGLGDPDLPGWGALVASGLPWAAQDHPWELLAGALPLTAALASVSLLGLGPSRLLFSRSIGNNRPSEPD